MTQEQVIIRQKAVAEKARELMKSQPKIIRCKNCEYSYYEGFACERLMCEKHPELGARPDDWFCADGWEP